MKSKKKFLLLVLAGLWLTACAHTGTREPTAPAKQERQQTSEAERSTPPDASASGAQSPREKPEASKTASSAPTGAERTESRDSSEPPSQSTRQESHTGQAPSKNATQSGQKSAAPNIGARPQSATPGADAKLEEARENLRVSQATEKRIASELEQLKKSGKASAEEIRNYESYHASVQSMVAENRKIVEKMEAAYAKGAPAEDTPAGAAPGSPDRLQNSKSPGETPQDEVAALDRKLNQSLAEFDQKLLNEMDAIREGSAAKLRDLAQEAADAAKRLRAKGMDADTDASESAEGKETSSADTSQGADAKTGADTQTAEGDGSPTTASTDTARKGGEGPSSKDQRRVDYDDDDIVARQLREAAENETDPELKKKLWKEYEDYKKNSR